MVFEMGTCSDSRAALP